MGFVRGSKSDDLFPYIFQNFHNVKHFQWERPNTTVTTLADRLWLLILSLSAVAICPTLKNAVNVFRPYNTKFGSNAFFSGNVHVLG